MQAAPATGTPPLLVVTAGRARPAAGTDVELQSGRGLAGRVHDFAFVGTMGAGVRIYDVTEPARPRWAGGGFDVYRLAG